MVARDIDIGPLLENRRIGRFQALTLSLGVLTLFVDGLDYSAVNAGSSAIVHAFGAQPSAMGQVFSVGYFGIFIGSVLFGVLGDKFGRRPALIVGVLAYSLPALATVFATSFQEVTFWRFLAGIGIGGVVPNVIALLTEAAPKRHRVTFVMASFVGYSAGNASIAQVATWFIPVYGWQVVFLVAGVTGVAFGAVLALFLPESIPYVAATKPDSPKLRDLVRRALPELALGTEDRVTLRRPKSETRFSLRLLFESYRRIATPLLWIAFFAESLTFMTFSSWLVLVLESAGLSSERATQTFSYASFGAMIAVFTLGRLIDHFGPKATVVSACIAAGTITYLGMPGLSPAALVAVAILAQASASATHQALNGIVGAYYPTIIRGNGVGIATGMGRVAAIIGPGVVGILMAAKVPLQEVLIFIAIPDLVVAAACVGLHLLRRSPAARADFERATPQSQEQLAKEQMA